MAGRNLCSCNRLPRAVKIKTPWDDETHGVKDRLDDGILSSHPGFSIRKIEFTCQRRTVHKYPAQPPQVCRGQDGLRPTVGVRLRSARARLDQRDRPLAQALESGWPGDVRHLNLDRTFPRGCRIGFIASNRVNKKSSCDGSPYNSPVRQLPTRTTDGTGSVCPQSTSRQCSLRDWA
jgi:hypothetical protein